jgi:ABC-type sugar transport system permease subunit
MEKSLKIPKRHRASLNARKARNGYFFIAPFIIGIILIYIPILLDSVWFSFYDMAYKTEGGQLVEYYKFAGLHYYRTAIGDTGFISALFAGLQRLIFEVPAVVIFSLFIAVVLNQKMLGRAVFRAIFFVPVIISTGFMETLLADDTASDYMEGGTNTGGNSTSSSDIISVLDIQKLFGEMKVGTELVAYVVTIVNGIYQYINYSGVQMLIFLAGLQSISPAIYEASQIEGATGWETFWKITFPMISPMILVNAIYSTINAFTRTTNPAMTHIAGVLDNSMKAAMSWIYFGVVMIIIGAVALIMSAFIFYQRRD